MDRYETDRLVLRSLTEKDAEQLLDYLLRNRDFLKEWEPHREENHYCIDSIKYEIERDRMAYENGTSLRLYVFNKGENRIIGVVALSNIVYGAFLSCFLGYKLDKDEINQGKMTEALRKLISIAFEEYSLHRIEANIIPRNIRSQKVVKKLGFVEEGQSREYLKINGKWEDHIHFVLLNENIE